MDVQPPPPPAYPYWGDPTFNSHEAVDRTPSYIPFHPSQYSPKVLHKTIRVNSAAPLKTFQLFLDWYQLVCHVWKNRNLRTEENIALLALHKIHWTTRAHFDFTRRIFFFFTNSNARRLSIHLVISYKGWALEYARRVAISQRKINIDSAGRNVYTF